jgi:hypothetical protein
LTKEEHVPNDDPKQIWQTQPTEPSTMTLEKIQKKVRELNARTRQDLIKAIASPVLVVVISCGAFAMMHDEAQRWVLAFAFAWSLAGQRALHRGMWLATLPGDAAMTAALEYYHREVERRRALYRRGLLWSFGPIVLALGAFCLPFARNRELLPGALPFMILVALWIVAFFILRMRIQRDLQREIDDLKNVERNNH